MSKSVLLINRGLSENYGDQGISFCLEKMLGDKGFKVKVVDYVHPSKEGSKENNQIKNGLSSSFLKLIKKFIPSIIKILIKNFPFYTSLLKENYDLVVIGGGQLLRDNRSFPSALLIWVIIFKIFHKKPMILFGVGARRDPLWWRRLLFLIALKGVDKIFIRDQLSNLVLKEKYKQSSSFVYDPAFTISHFSKVGKIKKQSSSEKPLALIGIVDYKKVVSDNYDTLATASEEQYLRYWTQSIGKYLKNGYDVELIYTSEIDIIQTKKLQNKYHEITGLHIPICEIENLSDILAKISNAKLIHSGRMHALIFGLSFRCKVEAYLRNAKLEEFKRSHIGKPLNMNDYRNQIFSALDKALYSVGMND